MESKLVAGRQRAHGERANQMLGLGNILQSESLSYRAFQKNYGKSVQVRAPGLLVEPLRRKAERSGMGRRWMGCGAVGYLFRFPCSLCHE
jgi:hypothetical protein